MHSKILITALKSKKEDKLIFFCNIIKPKSYINLLYKLLIHFYFCYTDEQADQEVFEFT